MNTKLHNTTDGMKTTVWGPAIWKFLFCSVLGSYPITYNPSDKEHIKIKKGFKNMLMSLEYTMPCIYCRQSYGRFIKELPIDDYLDTRINLANWLYKLKDKVNKKLIAQELECLKTEHNKLLKKLEQKKITIIQYNEKYKELKLQNLQTIKSPPFKDVLQTYQKHRADCANVIKKCL